MTGVILSHDASQNRQWEGNTCIDESNGKDCSEWQCTGRSVSQGYSVDPHKDEGGWNGEEPGSEEYAANPCLAAHLEVKPSRDEATDGTSQAVKHNHTGKDGSTTSGRDNICQCQDE